MNAAPNREISNDFMKCWISTSFRLLGMPHRKNSAVTRRNGTIWPAGTSAWFAAGGAALEAGSFIRGIAGIHDACGERNRPARRLKLQNVVVSVERSKT